MSFRDRRDAGQRLAAALSGYADEEPIVLALPRGGVPVAAEVATALGAPLDLVLVRKLGAPQNPELAMGAVADCDRPVVIWNEEVVAGLGVSQDQQGRVLEAELAEMERRRRRYLAGRPATPVAGRTAIVVDDGLATGATMRAALRAVRSRRPKTLVMAVPVAPPETLSSMADEADAVVCLEAPSRFWGVGAHYRDFTQVSDEEVVAALARRAPPAEGVPPRHGAGAL